MILFQSFFLVLPVFIFIPVVYILHCILRSQTHQLVHCLPLFMRLFSVLLPAWFLMFCALALFVMALAFFVMMYVYSHPDSMRPGNEQHLNLTDL
jgi:hypothetical protein